MFVETQDFADSLRLDKIARALQDRSWLQRLSNKYVNLFRDEADEAATKVAVKSGSEKWQRVAESGRKWQFVAIR